MSTSPSDMLMWKGKAQAEGLRPRETKRRSMGNWECSEQEKYSLSEKAHQSFDLGVQYQMVSLKTHTQVTLYRLRRLLITHLGIRMNTHKVAGKETMNLKE